MVQQLRSGSGQPSQFVRIGYVLFTAGLCIAVHLEFDRWSKQRCYGGHYKLCIITSLPRHFLVWPHNPLVALWPKIPLERIKQRIGPVKYTHFIQAFWSCKLYLYNCVSRFVIRNSMTSLAEWPHEKVDHNRIDPSFIARSGGSLEVEAGDERPPGHLGFERVHLQIGRHVKIILVAHTGYRITNGGEQRVLVGEAERGAGSCRSHECGGLVQFGLRNTAQAPLKMLQHGF